MPVLQFQTALIGETWQHDVRVEVAGSRITRVDSGVAAGGNVERVRGIAVPGLANVHSHAFQRAMAGLGERRGREDDSFWSWREVMYKFLAALSPEDVEAIAAWVHVEMLEAGFTRVGEFHYLHHAPDGRPYADIAEMAARIVTAASQSGIGLTLLPSFYAHGGCGGLLPTTGQRRFVNDLDGFGRLMAACDRHLAHLPADQRGLGIAPHSLRAVAPDELAHLLDMHRTGPIHIHAAEQMREVEECLAWSGQRPVAWLIENGSVDARWSFIHATHMTDAETQALARSGATAALCPITESNLGDGIFPATRFMAGAAPGTHGPGIAIGSDSNVRISLAEELRTLEYSQRLRDQKRNRLGPEGGSTGRYLFDLANLGGMRSLGCGNDAGAIAAGRVADIVVLDAEHPTLAGRRGDAALDAWVFAGGNELVRDVWCGGRQVVSNGRHVARDQLAATFKAAMTRLADGL